MREKLSILPELLSALALIVAGPVAGSTLNYSEAESGDLGQQNPHVFALGPGINTLKGVVSFSSEETESPNYTGDRDPFVLVVAEGLRLDRVSLTMLPLNGTIFGSEWSVFKDGDFSRTPNVFIQSFNVYKQTWDVTFTPGSYLFFHSSLGGQFNSAWTHEWEFAVSGIPTPVPEPSTLALSIVGLAGAASIKRRCLGDA